MRTALLLLPLLVAACEPSTPASDFTSGDFQFRTLAVSDGCLDGAMNVLFMPEGEPADFPDPIYLPGVDDLPATYEIDLPDPFSEMTVTVTGDGESLHVEGAENTGVEFDADTYPGCLVDTIIDVALVIDSADTAHGTAVLTTSNFDGESCPEPDDDPCDVVATLEADRL